MGRRLGLRSTTTPLFHTRRHTHEDHHETCPRVHHAGKRGAAAVAGKQSGTCARQPCRQGQADGAVSQRHARGAKARPEQREGPEESERRSGCGERGRRGQGRAAAAAAGRRQQEQVCPGAGAAGAGHDQVQRRRLQGRHRAAAALAGDRGDAERHLLPAGIHVGAVPARGRPVPGRAGHHHQVARRGQEGNRPLLRGRGQRGLPSRQVPRGNCRDQEGAVADRQAGEQLEPDPDGQLLRFRPE